MYFLVEGQRKETLKYLKSGLGGITIKPKFTFFLDSANTNDGFKQQSHLL